MEHNSETAKRFIGLIRGAKAGAQPVAFAIGEAGNKQFVNIKRGKPGPALAELMTTKPAPKPVNSGTLVFDGTEILLLCRKPPAVVKIKAALINYFTEHKASLPTRQIVCKAPGEWEDPDASESEGETEEVGGSPKETVHTAHETEPTAIEEESEESPQDEPQEDPKTADLSRRVKEETERLTAMAKAELERLDVEEEQLAKANYTVIGKLLQRHVTALKTGASIGDFNGDIAKITLAIASPSKLFALVGLDGGGGGKDGGDELSAFKADGAKAWAGVRAKVESQIQALRDAIIAVVETEPDEMASAISGRFHQLDIIPDGLDDRLSKAFDGIAKLKDEKSRGVLKTRALQICDDYRKVLETGNAAGIDANPFGVATEIAASVERALKAAEAALR